jgi:hypothetical protein
MYADDLQIWISCVSSEVAHALGELETCVQCVRKWLYENCLVINDNKSEMIAFGTVAQLKKVPPLRLKIGEEYIKQSEIVRNLGVLFDSNLKFNKHAEKTCRTCYWHLKTIGRIRTCLDKQTCKTVVNSLVISRVDYCVALMHGIDKKVIQKLERVIRTCVRFIEGMRKRDDVASKIKQGKWMTVEQRGILRLSLIIHNLMRTSLPVYLGRLLISPLQSKQGLRSYSQKLLSIPRTRTTLGKRMFSVSGAVVWNNVPLEIRNIISHEIFRLKMIEYLMSVSD